MDKRLLLGLIWFIGTCLAVTELEQKILDAADAAEKIIIERNRWLKGKSQTERETQKANVNSMLEQLRGDLFSEMTTILVNNNGPEILSALEGIDVDALLSSRETRAKRYASQPKGSTTLCTPDIADCEHKFHQQYRSVTGICNNKRQKKQGAAVTPTRRLLGKASYEDGVGSIRSKSVAGGALPSARAVSNALQDPTAENHYDLQTNHLHMQFGQFIAHDIIFMPSSTAPSGETLDCSACNSATATPNCAPIPVPANDSYFPSGGCIRLTRSLNGQTGLGPRQQIDQNTHFADLSAVYGSEECEAQSLRSFTEGKLKVYNGAGFPLPPQSPNDTNCQSGNPNYCFLAGDFRNSLHPGLIPLHTVFILEHNRIATAFLKQFPTWNDEKIFQETRRIMIAQYQHFIYNEYLPKLLGDNTMNAFNLRPLTVGQTDYDGRINPSLAIEFTTAGFRFGHTQVRKDIVRKNNTNGTLGSYDLGSNFFYADSLYAKNVGTTESMLEGMIQNPAMRVDGQFSFPIRNQVFETRGKKASGVDLLATNIMRGRDTGVLAYNEYRQKTNRPKARRWEDLLADFSEANLNILKSVYKDFNDIDLYTAVVLEKPANGAMVGITGAYIIAETFAGLKFGDRFYYEHRGNLNKEELDAVRQTSLNKVLCENSPNMKQVNTRIFDLKSTDVACSSLKSINITAFF